MLYRITIYVLLGLIEATAGTVSGPCLNDGDCGGTQGLICNFGLFGGCSQGFCTCPSTQAFDQNAGVCRGLILLGSSCTASDVCSGSDSACISGNCACVNGTASQDNKQCLPLNAKSLGDSCDSSVDICYVFDGTSYVSNGELVACISSTCSCRAGTTQSGSLCLQKEIGSGNCTTGTCMGGAVCTSNTCVCPSGTKSTKSNTYCAANIATTDIEDGGNCDENNPNPTSICASGFSCKGCPGDRSYQCVRNHGRRLSDNFTLLVTIFSLLVISITQQ